MPPRKSDALFLVDERGCWIWLLARNTQGYGLRWRPETKRLDTAHRWAYELFNGQVPEGMQVHHRCKVRACVNPEHLEAVTPREHYKLTHPNRKRIVHGPARPEIRQVDPADCIHWQGCRDRDGYGGKWANGRRMMAHRWAYEQRYGPIPDGMALDHLCRNRGCVNPEHLEVVSYQENARRSNWREACVHGHAYTPENTLWERTGKRKCRICRAAMRERAKQRQREQEQPSKPS